MFFFSPPCTKNPPAVPTKSWQPAIGQHPNRPQWQPQLVGLPALEDRLRAKCGKIMGERGKTREYMGTKTENHGKIWQNHHVQIIFGMENHGLTMYYHGSEILHKSSRATNKCSTKPGLQMKVLLNNAVCLHMIFRSRQHMANQNSDWYNNNGQLRIIKLKNIGRNDPPTPPFLVVSNLAIF